MGAYNKEYIKRYELYKKYGYELVFRPHNSGSLGGKKGNIDTDLVFFCMRDVYEDKSLDKVLVVSRDGDYFRMVKHLYSSGKLEKVLLPSKKNASSLYKQLSNEVFIVIDEHKIKDKVMKR